MRQNKSLCLSCFGGSSSITNHVCQSAYTIVIVILCGTKTLLCDDIPFLKLGKIICGLLCIDKWLLTSPFVLFNFRVFASTLFLFLSSLSPAAVNTFADCLIVLLQVKMEFQCFSAVCYCFCFPAFYAQDEMMCVLKCYFISLSSWFTFHFRFGGLKLRFKFIMDYTMEKYTIVAHSRASFSLLILLSKKTSNIRCTCAHQHRLI